MGCDCNKANKKAEKVKQPMWRKRAAKRQQEKKESDDA